MPNIGFKHTEESKQKIKEASIGKHVGELNSSYKHGLRNHPLYKVWSEMRRRCNSPKARSYKDYGARGITVCSDWDDLTTFIQWGESHGYEKGLYIDRIDVNGNYEPSNCRFISAIINNINTRPHKKLDGLPQGVCKQGNKYQARITDVRGIRHNLGSYDTPEQAHLVWCIADAIRSIDIDTSLIMT